MGCYKLLRSTSCLHISPSETNKTNVSFAFEITVTGEITVYGKVKPKEAFVVESCSRF